MKKNTIIIAFLWLTALTVAIFWLYFRPMPVSKGKATIECNTAIGLDFEKVCAKSKKEAEDKIKRIVLQHFQCTRGECIPELLFTTTPTGECLFGDLSSGTEYDVHVSFYCKVP